MNVALANIPLIEIISLKQHTCTSCDTMTGVIHKLYKAGCIHLISLTQKSSGDLRYCTSLKKHPTSITGKCM